MKLTKNFSKSEFDCKCGCEMPEKVLYNIKVLVEDLQYLRDYLNKSIKINSGYRCENHNRDIGGVVDSQHIKGLASDIVVKDKTPLDIFSIIDKLKKEGKLKKGGLGLYNSFVHYDIRGYNVKW